MKFWVRIEGREKTVEIEQQNGLYKVTVDGESRLVDCQSAGHKDYLSLIVDNRSHLIECAPLKIDEGLYYANVGGRRYEAEVLDERLVATRQASRASAATGPHVIHSPMPGLIVDVRVEVGDRIEPGTAVVIMEAMKMQNELISEVGGTVSAVNVKSRDTVDSQTPLIEIERAE